MFAVGLLEPNCFNALTKLHRFALATVIVGSHQVLLFDLAFKIIWYDYQSINLTLVLILILIINWFK